MTDDATRETITALATEIVGQVEPENIFVVEDSADALPEDLLRADAQDEGRFMGGGDASVFAALVIPFLMGFVGRVAEDVAKDQAKKIFARLLDKVVKRKATAAADTAKLKSDIYGAIAKSRFSRQQRDTLVAGFEKLFAKLPD